ncbi:MAG: VWA domain-containing protein [Chromatiales bacterium]|jgi:Ca-activated chloride channel family protein
MPEIGFHFAEPGWLWALLAILPMAWWLRKSPATGYQGRIRRYADAFLLPFLTGSRELKPAERWRRFAFWALLWSLLAVAMAGPRWDYTDVRLFRPGANLVILLDISKSMDVSDVQPSRLARARQEVEDLISQNRELRIGLIAFASVAHVVSPITEDAATIKAQLPAISTDLVALQGSRLEIALQRARELLAGQPEDSANSILLISDGDFPEEDLEQQVKALSDDGITLHVMGVGTPGGGPVPARFGRWMSGSGGKAVESRLDVAGLSALAEAGGGVFITADYRDSDTREILELASRGQKARAAEGDARTRVWNERFYWLVLLVMVLLFPLFRGRTTALRAEAEK